MNVNIKRSGIGHKNSSLAVKEERAQQGCEEYQTLSPVQLSGDAQQNGLVVQDGLVVIVNKGDSMEKLIMDGAAVVVDTFERTIVSGSVYAFSMPWEGCILRECQASPNGLTLIPYNKNYATTYVPWDEYDQEMVIGKVYCSIMNVFR